MILVDTNVWSELLRPAPAPAVIAWEIAEANGLYMSTVVIGEFLSGVAMMPEGKRKSDFLKRYEPIIRLYADRIVPFDLDAARHYADILAAQERAGRNPGTADTQIAATARARGMALATRNVKHFEGLGLDLIDPWQA